MDTDNEDWPELMEDIATISEIELSLAGSKVPETCVTDTDKLGDLNPADSTTRNATECGLVLDKSAPETDAAGDLNLYNSPSVTDTVCRLIIPDNCTQSTDNAGDQTLDDNLPAIRQCQVSDNGNTSKDGTRENLENLELGVEITDSISVLSSVNSTAAVDNSSTDFGIAFGLSYETPDTVTDIVGDLIPESSITATDIDGCQINTTNRSADVPTHFDPYQSDGSEDIPLSKLRDKQTTIEFQSDVENNSEVSQIESDNSVDDPDFKLSKKDMPISDTEYDTEESLCSESSPHVHKRKRHKKVAIRETLPQKKPPKHFKLQQNKRGLSRKQHSYKRLKEVLSKSKRLEKLRNMVQKIHCEKLDALLNSNGLKRKQISSDGDCFFVATLQQLDDPTLTTVNELRDKLCDHLMNRRDLYAAYHVAGEDSNNRSYTAAVEYLRGAGHWSSNLADVLPLAVANLFSAHVKIYSSNPSNPIIDIRPAVVPSLPWKFRYALNAHRGHEHYDGCSPLHSDGGSRNKHQNLGDTVPMGLNDSSVQNEDSTTTVTSNRQASTTPVKRKENEKSLTPRKCANYISPKRRCYSRKRKAQPEKWKKNVRKRLCVTGKEYQSSTGKPRHARELKECNCQCKFKCSSKLSEKERQSVFNSYWAIESRERKYDFICQYVTEAPTVRKTTQRKSMARQYMLPTGNGTVRVCKRFFLATLDISDQSVNGPLLRQREGCVHTSKDKRGRHSPGNKTPEASLRLVREHIESFPTLSSHYSRKDTGRRFLGKDLTVRKMYELYTVKCSENGNKPISQKIYRKVFNEEYNLSFHVPKKDQCVQCELYNKMKEASEMDEDTETRYQLHQERKLNARQEKEKDKKYSQDDQHFHVCTFDMQAVLTVPCGLVSQLYYKRKLNCYNLSVYSLSDKEAKCFLWNETEGRKGSCEVATCLVLHLRSLPHIVNHVCFYSDTCGGQNRNINVAAALHNEVINNPNLNVIDQKFFESGHLQMECDSVHSSIEFVKKRTAVYIPSMWDTLICVARRRNPYLVVPMKFSDFIDFEKISHERFKNIRDEEGKKVQWLKLKWIRYMKAEPEVVYFKYDMKSEEFNSMKIVRQSSRSRPSLFQIFGCELPKKYGAKLPVSENKKRDLVSLCTMGIIPEEHHDYYRSMATDRETERLAEADVLESSEDEL